MSAELHWADLPKLRKLLDSGAIGAVELLEQQVSRARDANQRINAICEWNTEQARQEALAFDQGQRKGPLAGIPMTVKESFDVAGLHTTRGIPANRERVMQADASAVARLRAAGALIFGKTNVPYNLADYQSYNEIYGATRNPWDATRTAGGSSGGSAAALAAGMTPIELGGDLGGSIRVPAHCCGVFGHRPTPGVVPFGRYTADNPVPPIDIAVAGPMARSAAALGTVFEVLAGPDAMTARGWQLRLPPARAQRLADFRVGIWLDDASFPVDEAVGAVLEDFVQRLQAQGVQVRRCRPPIEASALNGLYQRLIRAATSLRPPPGDLERWRESLAGAAQPEQEHELQGVFMTHRAWLADDEQRHRLRWQCSTMFDDGLDVILTPALAVTAFPNQHHEDVRERRWQVNGQDRPYRERLFWSALAGLAGLPATVMPAGVARDGLPVGVQVLGAPFDDHTTLAFCAAAEAALGGFRAPAEPGAQHERGEQHG